MFTKNLQLLNNIVNHILHIYTRKCWFWV